MLEDGKKMEGWMDRWIVNLYYIRYLGQLKRISQACELKEICK